jgi:hypothetical protein
VVLADQHREIRDFKTGAAKPQHELQLRIYALLWMRDHEVNPSGAPMTKLVLSYSTGTVDVPAPRELELEELAREMGARTEAAVRHLQGDPPEARPSRETCSFCAVRHLCDEFWTAAQGSVFEKRSADGFDDLQIRIYAPHGSTSWDGTIEASVQTGFVGPVLLRLTEASDDVRPGRRIRVLGGYVSAPEAEQVRHTTSPTIVSVGSGAEIFVMAD